MTYKTESFCAWAQSKSELWNSTRGCDDTDVETAYAEIAETCQCGKPIKYKGEPYYVDGVTAALDIKRLHRP